MRKEHFSSACNVQECFKHELQQTLQEEAVYADSFLSWRMAQCQFIDYMWTCSVSLQGGPFFEVASMSTSSSVNYSKDQMWKPEHTADDSYNAVSQKINFLFGNSRTVGMKAMSKPVT